MITTEDTVLGGRVHLVQPEKGFRAGTDSVLLAAALNAGPGASCLEIGTGCGGALLPAAWRLPEAAFTGLEIDPAMAELARTGARKNGFEARLNIQQGEASEWVKTRENSFDCVFSNPPYFTEGTIHAPAEGRAGAYLESLPLENWIKAMMFAARPRAPLVIIHRAAELARILAAFDRWTGEISVLPIAQHEGEEANRVLVRGRKGLKRGRVRLLAPFIVRAKEAGTFSPAMEAVHDGGGLDW